MLVACLLISLFYGNAQCQKLLPAQHQEDDLIKCIINILDKYYSQKLTYVNLSPYGDELLKAIHSTTNFSFITRQSTHQMQRHNHGYLVYSMNIDDFTEYFEHLIREPAWNPNVRFLIMIKSLQDLELTLAFDMLLKQHVNNVVIINGTKDGNLYTYNPFDKYACGRYYETIVSLGQCSRTTNNLYPDKLVTGLRNCTFRASVAHRPPFSIDPMKTHEKRSILGTEEYILMLLADLEQFTITVNYSYNGELFSTVAPNMTAIGPMEMLQKNECDIIFGGMMMVSSRAEAFTFLCGYHDYSDELLFAVKISSYLPVWKYIYQEFELDVWIVLLLVFIVYSVIVIILLRSEDAGEIVLRLLDNLLLHGRDVRARLPVKCVLITWVWFSYLINTFYQSSLFSFTTQPSKEYQVADEEALMRYNFEPCFSSALRIYLFTETSKFSNKGNFTVKGCETTPESMYTISTTDNMFTLVPNYYYLYNKQKYKNKWGEPLIYYFNKPYTKFLFGYFFYKGFPITRTLQLNALRMRESGLADKSLNDHYYQRRLKQRFSQKSFRPQFLFPWWVFSMGVVIATITFIGELLIKYSRRLTFVYFQ